MRKLWLVIKREYLTRVRTKGFIFSTVAVPMFAIGVLAFQIYTATRQIDHTLKIAVLDEGGGLSDAIERNLDGKLANGQPTFQVVRKEENATGAQQDAARRDVKSGQLDAFLLVPAGISSGKDAAELHTRNTGEIQVTEQVDHAVTNAVIAERLHGRGLNVPDVGDLVKAVDLKLIKTSAGGEIEEKGQTLITALVVGMLLYTTLIIYGVTTMRSVTEEKSSRVMEILVASVRPFQLLAGKIVGVAAVGLTQYAIWGTVTGLMAAYGTAMAAALRPGSALPAMQPHISVLAYMLVFFLCGYMLYASMYAAIGALVSNDQEAQQLQTPLTLLLVGAFLLFNVVLHDPSSSLSVGLSMIPFFAPILMMLRIAMQTPPFWQIALCIGISVLTTTAVIYVAARVYRVGVLMYGKRPSLVELARWLRYS
jgi:ABC-2 type transport system permease protein